MPQAPAYIPTESFSNSEANNAGGRSTVRTAQLDAEFTGVSITTEALANNLELIQRDDGKLRDAIVEPYHLSAATKAYALATKWAAAGLWVTLKAYAVNDLVDRAGTGYVCFIAHTSGVFATDYAAGRWQIFSGSAAASAVTFIPTTTIVAIDAQAAISEVDTKSRAGYMPAFSALYGGF